MDEHDLQAARHSGSIIIYNKLHKEVAYRYLENAWPARITGPLPKADSNEIDIEEITTTHEHIERVLVLPEWKKQFIASQRIGYGLS